MQRRGGGCAARLRHQIGRSGAQRRPPGSQRSSAAGAPRSARGVPVCAPVCAACDDMFSAVECARGPLCRMGKGTPLSRSMREDIVAFATMGHNVQQTRTLLGGPLRGLRALPSARSIRRVRCTWRLHGVVGAGKKRGIGYKGRGLTASLALTIRAWCRQPDGQKRGTRLRRLQKFLSMHPHVNRVVPVSTLCRWLKRMGLTRKKGTRVALQQDPEKVSAFWTRCQLLRVDPDLTVWFDDGFSGRHSLSGNGGLPCQSIVRFRH